MLEQNVIEMLIRIDKKLDDQAEVISDIKVAQASLPCGKNDLRLKLLEKVVFGAVALVLITVIGAILSNNNKTTAANSIKATKQVERMVNN